MQGLGFAVLFLVLGTHSLGEAASLTGDGVRGDRRALHGGGTKVLTCICAQ